MVDSLQCNRNTTAALKVLIPTAGNGPASPTGLNGPGTPTGVVFNGSQTDFQIQGNAAVFIFATLDGTISALGAGREHQPSDDRGGQLGQ